MYKLAVPYNVVEGRDTGFFIAGTSQTGKSTLAKHIVQQIIDSGDCVYVLDVSKTWSENSPIQKVYEYKNEDNDIELAPTVSAVLDIADLGFERRIKFVNAFTKMVTMWHRKQGHKKAPQAFIFYEESHTYFPNGCFRSPRKYAPCVDLVTIGANYNLRFGLITQFPALVDKTLVTITQQRYFGRTTEPNDLNYIKNFIGKKWIKDDNPDRIQRFGKGQFLYNYNDIEKIQSTPYQAKPKVAYTIEGQPIQLAYCI